ncbi:MAG: hypothetical protein QXZ31_10445 [Thermofilaceae archaeon]
MSSSERVVQQLASVERAVRRLEESFNRGIKSVIEELRSIQGEFKAARKEIGGRLIELLAQQIALDYVEIESREDAIRKQLRYMEQKTEEARRIFRDRFKEILSSYLGVVRDYLSQFLDMSEGEFAILGKLLAAEQKAEATYRLVKPSWINDELVKAALGFDVKTRAENFESLVSDLEKMHSTFVAQRESLSSAERVISSYSFPADTATPGTVLYLPVLIVELEVDGKTLVGVKKPLDSEAPLARLVADEAFRARSEYVLETSEEDLKQIAERITTLARTDDEKRLFESVRIEVV